MNATFFFHLVDVDVDVFSKVISEASKLPRENDHQSFNKQISFSSQMLDEKTSEAKQALEAENFVFCPLDLVMPET